MRDAEERRPFEHRQVPLDVLKGSGVEAGGRESTHRAQRDQHAGARHEEGRQAQAAHERARGRPGHERGDHEDANSDHRGHGASGPTPAVTARRCQPGLGGALEGAPAARVAQRERHAQQEPQDRHRQHHPHPPLGRPGEVDLDVAPAGVGSDEPSVGVPVDEGGRAQRTAVHRRLPAEVVALAEHEPERLRGRLDPHPLGRAAVVLDRDVGRGPRRRRGWCDAAGRGRGHAAAPRGRREDQAIEVDARDPPAGRTEDVLPRSQRDAAGIGTAEVDRERPSGFGPTGVAGDAHGHLAIVDREQVVAAAAVERRGRRRHLDARDAGLGDGDGERLGGPAEVVAGHPRLDRLELDPHRLAGERPPQLQGNGDRGPLA